jgi:arabinose-5-phosphate isomerase
MEQFLLKISKQVLDNAIEGIESLREVIQSNEFSSLIDALGTAKGKIVISGMGKSGIVAKKISATFSSTGSPSFFIHPAEASHGDLGMIGKDDVVIMLSNSGETNELKDLILYTKKYHIKSVAITCVKNSTLAKNCDISIIIPKISEAVDFNAPTTSTTMMMVLGDAIAVTMIEKRGFNADDYKVFHPGGKLGASFVKVSDIMHTNVELPLCSAETNIKEIVSIISNKKLGVAIVVDQNHKLLGIVTDGDVRRAITNYSNDLKASEIMTKQPRAILANKLSIEALDIMNQLQITSLVIVDESEEPVGLIHLHDCLKAGIML